MKSIVSLVIITFFTTFVFSQDTLQNYQAQIDSIESSFTYEHGKISLKNGIGYITVPAGFKYLDAAQAESVLVDLWGNPGGENLTLGFIMPESQGVLSDSGYVFNIQYQEIGYVKDNDADDIDYADLLKQLQKETVQENKEREKMGYDPIQIVGWAAKPFYDKEKKILHWAQEIKFGDQEINTLNYNVRILGRKGVIVLNAIGSMPNLPMVQKDIPQVLDIAQFSEGLSYKDFNPSTDDVAAWTIGGLVAGKLLAKAGFFAFLLKFWKLIALGVAGFGGVIWKKIRGRKEEPAVETAPQLPEDNAGKM